MEVLNRVLLRRGGRLLWQRRQERAAWEGSTAGGARGAGHDAGRWCGGAACVARGEGGGGGAVGA